MLNGGRCLYIGLACWLVMAAGCAMLPPQACSQLRQADEQYRCGELTAAERLTGGIIAQYPQAPGTAEAHYIRGLVRIRQGRNVEAKQDLTRATELSKRRELTALAGSSMGMILQREGADEKAAQWFERSIAGLPAGGTYDEVLYRYGISAQRSGDWKAARQAFNRLCSEYADSTYAADAARRARWPGDYFSIQGGLFDRAANAERLMSTLRAAGLAPTLISDADGQGRHAVRVGRFADYASASRALPRVRQTVSDAFIVP
jgi:TolA-binding protein